MFSSQVPRQFQLVSRCLHTGTSLAAAAATTSTKTGFTHYDALGISPKANHAEIKSAYYDLSKMYHPDRNDGSTDAANKFRAISEAYEVLGNVRLRRLYDRGFLHIGTPGTPAAPYHPDDPSVEFHRARDRRHRPPPPPGNSTPIYDFDEWSRNHYGATFAKDMRIRERRRRHEHMERNESREMQSERVLFGIAIGMFVLMYISTAGPAEGRGGDDNVAVMVDNK